MRSHTEKLGTDPIMPLLWKLGIPSITGLLIANLYVLVDRIFVGRYVGESGLAAMNAVMPLMMIVHAISILIGRGTAVLYSISLGRKDYAESQRIFGQSVFLYAVAAGVITVVGILFLDQLLELFGLPEGALSYGRSYLSVSLFGTIFIMLGFHNNLIRAEGYSALAMFTQIIGAAVNVGLDYLFVAKFGWGMAGAAWATVAAQGLSAAWVVGYFCSKLSIAKFDWKTFRVYGWNYIGRIVYNGCSPFAINIAGSFIWSVQNHMLLAHGGKAAMAAFGVILTINQLLMGLVFGVCMGMQVLVGYNTGAKNYRRVLHSFAGSAAVAGILLIGPYLAIQFFARPVFSLFIGESNPELLDIGVYSMRRFLLLMPIGSASILVSQYFQGTGRAPVSLLIAMTRQLLFQLPLIFLLPPIFGYDGVLFSGPLGDSLAFLIAWTIMFREIKKLKQKIRLSDAVTAQESTSPL